MWVGDVGTGVLGMIVATYMYGCEWGMCHCDMWGVGSVHHACLTKGCKVCQWPGSMCVCQGCVLRVYIHS